MEKGKRVGELGMPSFKMDSYFMKPPGRAAPLCVTFSTLKVHCLWNLIFGSNFYLFHWYQWTVSGTTFVHCWGRPLTEILRSKNSSRTTSWRGITCPNPIPKQSALSKMWGPAGWPGRRLGNRAHSKKALEQPPGNLPACQGKRAMIFLLKHSTSWRKRLRMDIKKHQTNLFSPWEQLSRGRRCPQRWCHLHPQRFHQTGSSPEWPVLTSQLILLPAEVGLEISYSPFKSESPSDLRSGSREQEDVKQSNTMKNQQESLAELWLEEFSMTIYIRAGNWEKALRIHHKHVRHREGCYLQR